MGIILQDYNTCFDMQYLIQLEIMYNVFYIVLQSNKFTQWQDHYLRGAGMEMYTEQFSQAFHGKTFPQAAEYVLVLILYLWSVHYICSYLIFVECTLHI